MLTIASTKSGILDAGIDSMMQGSRAEKYCNLLTNSI